MLTFEEILKLSQKKLFNTLRREYASELCAFQSNSFILVKGEAPVMLVAHLDTVHANAVKTICKSDDGNIWMSPEGIGGDDRCGVYGITQIHNQAQLKPWLLFTCDEEIGGVGASGFSKNISGKNNKIQQQLKGLKYIVELDRKGSNDAVYYGCGNKEFEDYVTSKGFKTAYGSFSDISVIAPELKIAAVNISSGYYNAHTQHEYINIEQLNIVIARIIEMIDESAQNSVPKYKYIEVPRKTYGSISYDDVYRRYFGCSSHNDFDLSFPSRLNAWSSINAIEQNSKLIPYSELPEVLKDAYAELLYLYTREELDNIRIDYGDDILLNMYEDEVNAGNLI